MQGIKRRHDNILDRVIAALPDKWKRRVRTDRTVPGVDSDLRPDIVAIDYQLKRAVILDIAIPFENGADAMQEADARKHLKYSPIAQQLQDQGIHVTLGANTTSTFWSDCAYRTVLGCHATYMLST
jgi:hypothetical protein